MTRYLISFPSEAMTVDAEDLPAVSAAARAVIDEAKRAGVLVVAGGIDERAAPLLVTADGMTREATHPGSRLTGGFTVLELATREEAIAWAGKIAQACRCAQELRAFMDDPGS